ncbi:formylglycine-generating enzyme family protein [Oceanobacillus timonensis]|uniref:formylglycine-generating enzyme family protein n=1 Tax=Oceanobacillus timonensis TaxID=1926285 RepID=UPI0009B94B48|nr:formylglycine-generating enzyme family protein [Oceanobacillus timonensis]
MRAKEEKKHSCCSVNRSDISKTNIEISLSDYRKKNIRFQDKMVYLSGGEFLMGTDNKEGFPSDKEGPIRNETVEPFYIDSHTVSNREFKQFVEATNYKTVAERFGWSFVFHEFLTFEQLNSEKQLQNVPWWYAVRDAFWYQPEGSGSSVDQRMDHPVVHISWYDAVSFCEWAGKRLPTEREWEFAARGGLEQKKYPWGDELTKDGIHYCNIWQGKFPQYNSKDDGYLGTAPATSFPPNNYGLYNMSGNVWEWCSDWFNKDNQSQKSMRGGSYLCHNSYCNRYRVAARSSNTMDSSSGNIGFRCVRDV